MLFQGLGLLVFSYPYNMCRWDLAWSVFNPTYVHSLNLVPRIMRTRVNQFCYFGSHARAYASLGASCSSCGREACSGEGATDQPPLHSCLRAATDVGILAFLLLWCHLTHCSPAFSWSSASAWLHVHQALLVQLTPKGLLILAYTSPRVKSPQNSSALITPLCTCREGVIHSPKVYLLSLIYKLHLTCPTVSNLKNMLTTQSNET